MHAVIVEVDVSGADRETALQRLREEIVPRVSSLPGFQSGTWLRPNQDAHGFSLLVFDSEENARSASEAVQVGSEPQPGVKVTRSELREVVVQA
ncbi:MAG TPA: hypothetical protein VHF89_13320 [Solirubrobacteraceae bacterium]|nr:hypothetical protein [Solirubrobacteraceae bacterium]